MNKKNAPEQPGHEQPPETAQPEHTSPQTPAPQEGETSSSQSHLRTTQLSNRDRKIGHVSDEHNRAIEAVRREQLKRVTAPESTAERPMHDRFEPKRFAG